MTRTDLFVFLVGVTILWFIVAGLGYFLFLYWRKKDLSRRKP